MSKMPDHVLGQIQDIISELKEDNTIPRNVINQIEAAENVFLEGDDDIHIKVDKVLQILEEVIEDSNLQPFIRTKLWNVCSLLESV